MKSFIISIALVSVTTSAPYAVAQNFPTRPVRIMTAEPGGGNDFLSRIVAPPLAAALGQQVIVDNRPSAQVGPLGAIANPDGHTLVIGGSTFQFVPLTVKSNWSPVTDYTGVSQLERSPNVLVVHPSLPVQSVKELIAYAKARPGQLNYGTGGTGGSLHLGGEKLMLATGISMQRIAYKSTGPAIVGLLGNEVQLAFSTPGGALPHVKSGKLRALAVTSSEPTPLMPGFPTMIAAGVPGFVVETIGFILAPVKTPQAVVRRLNQEIVRIMAQPEIKAQLLVGGSEAFSSTPEEITRKIAEQDAEHRKLFATLGILAK